MFVESVMHIACSQNWISWWGKLCKLKHYLVELAPRVFFCENFMIFEPGVRKNLWNLVKIYRYKYALHGGWKIVIHMLISQYWMFLESFVLVECLEDGMSLWGKLCKLQFYWLELTQRAIFCEISLIFQTVLRKNLWNQSKCSLVKICPVWWMKVR